MSSSQRRGLYDIPSLPESMMKQKYLQTSNVFYDPNSVENFLKETIRYTGSDAPAREEEMPRRGRNPMSQSLLSMQENGGRYSHAPFHPEMFLGDLTKDQRGTTTDTRVDQLADQYRFRQSRYIHGKLQDVADVRTEGMVGTKRMLRQVKEGYNNTATRMGGIFDDSTNNMVARTNPHPGNSTHKVGDSLKEDQVIYQSNGETIIPSYGTDIVGKLSNMIGVQWAVQPEAKQKISSVSNVYRTKQDVDLAANAVFRLGQQDTSFKTEKQTFVATTPAQTLAAVRQAKLNAQSTRVSTGKESMQNHMLFTRQLPPAPIAHVERFVGTQSVNGQIIVKANARKFLGGQPIVESLYEPLSEKGIVTSSASTIPTKDLLSAVRKVRRTQDNAIRNEDKFSNRKMGIKALKDGFESNDKSVQSQKQGDNTQATRYINKAPDTSIDHISNVRLTATKNGDKEQLASNPTGSNAVPLPNSVDDFEFDTDPTMNNNYQTRSGVRPRSTRLSRMQESDNTISPLNDTIVPFRTKYSS